MMRAKDLHRPLDRAVEPPLARQLVELHRTAPDEARDALRQLLHGLPLATAHAAESAEAVLAATLEASAVLDLESATHALGIACSLVSPYPHSAPQPPLGDEPSAVGRLATSLAVAGADAPSRAFEGRHGLLAVLGARDPSVADVASRPRSASAATERTSLIGASTTAALAEWAAGVDAGDLPRAARDAARTMLSNSGALIIAAMRAPALERLAADLPIGSGAALPVLADVAPRPAADAALLYGVAGHLEDFDDTHLASVTHPGSCAVPAVLALWPSLRPGADELVAAVAVGAEVAIRLAEPLEPALRRGWHISALVAPVAAAAAAGRLLGFDARGLASAMAAAATRASGLTEALGTLTKSVHLGHGASVGVRAALLAGRAVPASGAHDPLGRLLDALGGTGAAARDGVWRIEQNRVKPYACGVLGHTPIDLALRLRALAAGSEPREMTLRVSPLAVQAMGRPAPATELEAKFSLAHAVAVGLVRGTADPADFMQAAIDQPAVRDARASVRVVADARLDRFEARLTASWSGGEADLHGSEPRSLDATGVRDKVRRLLGSAVGDHAGVSDLLLDDDLADFGGLWNILSSAHPTPSSTIQPEALQ